MDELKKRFHKDMVNIYLTAAKELNYKASRFFEMVNKYGGFEAAMKLVSTSGGTYGFEVLWEKDRLDLSVEALILSEEYKVLFKNDILEICQQRLASYGYVIPKNRGNKEDEVHFKQDISINKEQWKDMFCNREIFHEKDSSLVLRIYNRGGKATATEIANEEGVHPSSYNTSIVNLGRRIKKFLNIEIPKDQFGKNRWWHVLFWGNYKDNGHFNWILRPELKEAIEELILLGTINLMPYVLTIPEIRIMPMSKEEFENKSIDTVQQEFFISDLRRRDDCLYYFKNTAINCPNNTLLLFQYDNTIIASGRLKKIIKYKVPKKGIYFGALQLLPNTIQIFDPITTNEMQNVDSGFKRFSQAKQTISLDSLPQILELIDSKKAITIAQEIDMEDMPNLFEGARKQITVNAYERNGQARKICIEFYGAVCQICGFDFEALYGTAFKGKIHVHHLKPLHEIDQEYQVDPVNDLIPVCPNCHLVVHSKNPPYTPQQVKEMIKR